MSYQDERNNPDMDWLRRKIEEENQKAPESLSGDHMLEKLMLDEMEDSGSENPSSFESRNEKERKDHNDQSGGSKFFKKRAKPVFAMAAGLAVIVVASAGVYQSNRMMPAGPAENTDMKTTEKKNAARNANPDIEQKAEPDEESGLIHFKDYQEIEAVIDQMIPEYTDSADYNGPGSIFKKFSNSFRMGSSGNKDAAAEEQAAAESDAAVNAVGAANASHSETYEQVEGVNEADIIKTDGKYIYYVESESYNIHIVSAKNGKTEEMSVITDNQSFTYFEDLYVRGDRLIATGRANRTPLTGEQDSAAVIVYDIKDRKHPKESTFYQQSGNILSSRMIGNEIYLVTNDYIYSKKRVIPYATNGGTYKKLEATDICACPNPGTADYIVVGALDVTSGKETKVRTKAVLGASSEIYCNRNNLYLTAADYSRGLLVKDEDVIVHDMADSDVVAEGTDIPDGGDEVEDVYVDDESIHTSIIRVELKDGKIAIKANGSVTGTIDNQFSMDEKDGYLRVATTSQRNGYDVNNLYVLDQNLNKVSELTGFAKTEHIEAVRYIGEKAYVITYEQTDPLFIIDLSNPKKPVMEGNAKISGFSTLLVPVNKETLLGVGFSTESTQFGEATNGLKFVTFNIKDSSNPKVADSVSFENYDSPAQYDHHALMVNAEKGYYAIPYTNWRTEGYVDGGNMDSGVIVFKVKDDQSIDVIKRFKSKEEVSRCIYIDDWIYALQAESDTFGSFRM